ncbi:MAG: YveK family protein [Eubacterium sp.]
MNERQKEHNNSYVNLLDVIRFIMAHFYWIILAGVIAGAAVYGITRFLITPIYESRVSFYVYNSADDYVNKSVNTNDLEAAESLATTYSKILSSNSVLDAVLEDLGDKSRNISRKELGAMTKASVVMNTQLLEVVVSSADANFACEIADSYARVAPQVMERITKVGGVEVVDQPEVATEQSSPRVIFDSAIGAAVGMILAMIILVLRMVSDRTIYLPDDLEDLGGLTVLGSIPQIEPDRKANGYWEVRERNTQKDDEEDSEKTQIRQ